MTIGAFFQRGQSWTPVYFRPTILQPTSDMAYRLAAAFGTSAELWAGLQLQYDLYQAGKVKRPKIERIAA
jgi:hypothetical protein